MPSIRTENKQNSSTPQPLAPRFEYRFQSELSSKLTIVVIADSEDSAKEELARIGLHPSFFQLVAQGEEDS